jgi:LPXTG-motif cell wall-anchored protein
MEDNMTEEDFIIENETDGSSRRPFLMIVAVLSTIFILAVACSFIYIFANGSVTNSARDDEVATRIALNETRTMENATVTAAIIASNTAVAQVNASSTALAQATETPEPTEAVSNTPSPIPDTATPEETAVVVVKETETPNVSGTSAIESADEDSSNTSEKTAESNTSTSETNETATPIPATSNNSDNAALPQTGINTWGTLIAGFLLIAILVAARRLRQA